MHAKYVASQFVQLNHVASKLSFVALAPHPGDGCTIENVSMSIYANRPLGSCAMHGQSCQVVIEDTVGQFAHTECQYTKYWHASAFELVWYHATKYVVVCYQFLALPLLVAGHLQIGL